jgi:hypothetical protein
MFVFLFASFVPQETKVLRKKSRRKYLEIIFIAKHFVSHQTSFGSIM